MPFTTRKMPSFEGVAAGQTATLRLPIGRTFHKLFIAYAGATLAQLNAIRLIANGEVIQKITECSKLDSMNQYEGRAAAAGVLVLDLERFGMLTRAGRELTALGTGAGEAGGISTLSLEIDIDAAAVGTTLSCKAKQSAPRPVGLVKKIKEFTYDAAAAGEKEISDLPKIGLINKIYVGGHTANVYTRVELERDNFIAFERTVAENELEQSDGVRVPQADFVVYDPTEDGYAAEVLVTKNVQDLRLKLDVTNAGSVPVTVEYLAPLEA